MVGRLVVLLLLLLLRGVMVITTDSGCCGSGCGGHIQHEPLHPKEVDPDIGEGTQEVVIAIGGASIEGDDEGDTDDQPIQVSCCCCCGCCCAISSGDQGVNVGSKPSKSNEAGSMLSLLIMMLSVVVVGIIIVEEVTGSIFGSTNGGCCVGCKDC